ncbi:MAG TPA: hypothetical protein PLG75_08025, partial [Methanoculleus sp.]|nr:hypothetical protein [Methanoculleus sp.]
GAKALRSYADTGNVPSLHQVRRILQGYTAKGTVYCGLPEKCPAWWTRRSSTNPPERVSLPVRRWALPGADSGARSLAGGGSLPAAFRREWRYAGSVLKGGAQP